MASTKLFDILVCPQCKGKLAQVEGGLGLLCNQCQLKYPVRDGIPVMLMEEASDMRGGTKPSGQAQHKAPTPGERTSVFSRKVHFKIIAGPDTNTEFDLEMGLCRALGRAIADTNKTAIINVDWALSLDEETKGLILQYISQQFRKPTFQQETTGKTTELGNFKRGTDIVFKDHSLSRLHAMIFFDTVGIGILDLVSKNGTFVNGQEIESCLLKKGDTIELGETKIVFEG